jgi:hypothetical protein
MDSILSQKHWALAAAGLVGGVAVLAILWTVYRRSARGQLRARLREHRRASRAFKAAVKRANRAESRFEKLKARAANVRPSMLEEAKGTLTDARALANIASDRQQVTANRVRQVIVDEFPPSRHERLRRRYLPQDEQDDRPFSFDS